MVVMKLNEEAIGGREGYLQRLVGDVVPGLRGGSSQERYEQSLDDNSNGLEANRQSGSGERDGVEPSWYPGDSGRRTRPNNTRQLAVEQKKVLNITPSSLRIM